MRNGLFISFLIVSIIFFSMTVYGETNQKDELTTGISTITPTSIPVENILQPMNGVAVFIGNTKILSKTGEGSIDTAPQVRNGRTLIPLRFISENLGAQVEWHSKERLVEIILDQKTLKITPGSNKVKVLRSTKVIQEVTLDVPAEIINSRVLVPIRAVAETLDKKVYYDNGLIVISDLEKMDGSTVERLKDKLCKHIWELDQDGVNLKCQVCKLTKTYKKGNDTVSLELSPEMKQAGIKIVVINEKQYYDFTNPFNNLLDRNTKVCQEILKTGKIPGSNQTAKAGPLDILFWYKDMVNNDGPWDIKRPAHWKEQLPELVFFDIYEKGGPRGFRQFVFNGELTMVEQMGNVTFAWWGRVLGYGPELIHWGAGYAQLNENEKLLAKKEGREPTEIDYFDQRLAGLYCGDDPQDYEMIDKGIALYNSKHPEESQDAALDFNPTKMLNLGQ